MALIRIDNVDKVYQTRSGEKVPALEGIGLEVTENEFVTLVGPSGCGKSTLLKIIAGLILPTAGKIYIGDTIVDRPRKDVGLVFQHPVLLPWRNILDNVMLPIEILNLSTKEHVGLARELLDLVGLSGFESKGPRELSGGMQQRAAISRALIYDPKVLLMDEPFGALDAMTREELSLELLRIWEEKRKTVVFVTHSIPEAILLADRVVAMTPRPGRIAKILEIKLPRPRTMEMEYTDQFKDYATTVREVIYACRRERRDGRA
ncbi:MAG: ABC transporter ATP-binding protein [Chloroflexi bacterium]|nr:ABC transporter ATP-binding protein [Chloroflexota bacterium]MCL5075427.1 ABC transporter ATP-binding protein [Chloroflexota bacterium]